MQIVREMRARNALSRLRVYAFTDTFVTAVAQQAYSFAPKHYPVYPDELW